jgi:predicted CXXCH cytochrome family protein
VSRPRLLARPGVGLVAVATLTAVATRTSGAHAQTLPDTDDCVGCHLGLSDSTLVAPARDYPSDVHARAGFGCLVCHGGPRTARGELDPGAGFLAAPGRAEIPALCGRCHSDAAFMRDYNPSIRVDQVTEYYSSIHGLRLRQEGDRDVATCVSCHPAHRILPPGDLDSSVHPLNVAELCGSCHADREIMAPRGEPFDQLADYRRSVHGHLLYDEGDVSAPTCNDCHGNHGAAPPGVSSVRNVCGECHAIMAGYFGDSEHVEVFEDAGLPGCETCHDNHAILPTSDAFLAERGESVCMRCHEQGDGSGEAFLDMLALIDSLRQARSTARAVLARAENAGMEVSEPTFELEAVDNSLTKARSAVHSFHVAPVADELEEGFDIAGEALADGLAALDEHGFRRVGLAVSVAIILILIVSLVLKIRALDARLERRTPGVGPTPSPPTAEGR